MGDSDDEFNKRRGRDKFIKERNDFQQEKRRDFAPSGGDRRSYGNAPRGNDYRTPTRPMRMESSPPAAKRPRREWDESPYESQPSLPSRREGMESVATVPPPSTTGVVATLMSFKQFLAMQDDSISDEDAIAKYHDYKLEFKRQQLHAFFVAHKDEEWFKIKYHPEESGKRKAEQTASVLRRLEVFQELMNKGCFENCNLDSVNAKNLVKLLDTVVVKLEGGTDEDVAALDKLDELFDDTYETAESKNETKEQPTVDEPEAVNRQQKKEAAYKNANGEDGAISDSEASEKGSIASVKSKHTPATPPEAAESNGIAARTENHTEMETGGEEEGAAVENEIENDVEGAVESETSPSKTSSSCPKICNKSPKHEATLAPPTRMSLHKTSSVFFRNLSPAITKGDVESLCKRFPGFLRVSLAEPIADRKFHRRGWVTFRRDVNIKEICWNLNSIRLKDCDMGPIVNRDLTKRIRLANGITAHRQVAQNDLRLAARLVQIYDKRFGLWCDTENTATADEEVAVATADPYTTAVEFNLTSRNSLLKNITDYLIEEGSAEEEELLGLSSGRLNQDADQKTVFERDDAILKVLDKILLYLRIVHSVDYYNHGEYPCEDEMPNRCGLIHVRGPPIPPSQYGSDEQGNTLIPISFVNEFCKGSETHLQPLLQSKERITDDEADRLGRKDPEKEVEAYITANCQELAKDKWLCPLSGKKFKGPEFIRKHIQNKHNDKLEEVRNEVLYFNSYLYDPKRPSPIEIKPQPYTQQPQSQAYGAGGGYGSSDYGRSSSGYERDRGGDRLNREMPPPSGPPQHQDYNYRSGGGGGGYDRGSGGGGSSGGGGGGFYRGGGGYRRDYYQRRDYGGGQGGSGGYGGGGRGSAPRHFQNEGRRDPRVPVTYTDLDAPDDVY